MAQFNFSRILNEDLEDWKFAYLSPELKDFLQKLFIKDPRQRLGKKGFEEIKNHPFFSVSVDMPKN